MNQPNIYYKTNSTGVSDAGKYHVNSVLFLCNSHVRFLLFWLFLIISTQLSAQIDQTIIPNYDSCKVSLIKFYQLKTESEQEQYKYKTRLNWLNYLPNIGWSFTTMSPIITTNFNDVAQQVNSKRINSSMLKSIQLKNEVLLNTDLLAIEYQLKILSEKLVQFEIVKQVYEVKMEKFEITEKQYKNNEITPTQFIQAKEEKLLATQNYNNAQFEIKNLNHLILEKAKQSNWVELPAIKLTINNQTIYDYN